ncbi:MAG: hypothetical protein J5801_00180 [Bacteroidales bacterium]|nr:hypothetical protein [Bacteroidales bacterium]
MSSSQKHSLNKKPIPVNPWLAEVIREYRQNRGDDYLRKRYKSFQDDYPRIGWTEFLEYTALEDKVAREPFLLTARKDFGFSQHLTDLLNSFQICNVADLLQFTVEEMKMLLEDLNESVDPIEQFLALHGYHLYSHKENTYKMTVLSVDKEQDEQKDIIRTLTGRITKIMSATSVPRRQKVEEAFSSFIDLEQMIRNADSNLASQLDVVIEFGKFLEAQMADYPDLAREAQRICERALYLTDIIHGKSHPVTTEVNEMCEAIYKKLKNL